MVAPFPLSAAARAQSDARLGTHGQTAGVLDIALQWDAAREGCDLIWRDGDWATDTTVVTPMLMALGCDRRARPNDDLPDAGTVWAQPAPGQPAPLVDFRRGWCGDALDARGERTGSRLWVATTRAKQTEQTRKLAEGAAAEALAQVQARFGARIALAVRWVQPGVLGIRASAGAAVLDIARRAAA